jgi:hypothetical protein
MRAGALDSPRRRPIGMHPRAARARAVACNLLVSGHDDGTTARRAGIAGRRACTDASSKERVS